MKRLVAGEEGGEGEIERKKTIETRGGEEFASFLIPLCHRRIRRQSPFSRLHPFHLRPFPLRPFVFHLRFPRDPRRTRRPLAPSVIFHAAISTLLSIGRSVSAFSLPFISDWNEIEIPIRFLSRGHRGISSSSSSSISFREWMIPFDFSNQERGSFVKLSTRRIVIEFESDPSFFFFFFM